MKRILTLLITLTSTSLYAFAGNNGCEQLNIQVLNKTDSECIFQGYKMVQGNLTEVTPNVAVIQPNATQVFVTKQNLVQGPDIILTYMCGGQRISIESLQNYCLTEAGRVKGLMLETDGQIQASHIQHDGSYYYSHQGNIYWALESRKR